MLGNDDRQAAREALLDPDARALRLECLLGLAEGMTKAGDGLRIAGTMLGPPGESPKDSRLVGLGYVANATGELLRGVQDSVTASNPYAAATLLRQVVETEYLAWAFADDGEEAASWLSSTRSTRQARWKPGHLRERSGGRFRGKDYGRHCDYGGHPTPEGMRRFFGRDAELAAAALVADALVHGRSAWRYLMDAADRYDEENGYDPCTVLTRTLRERPQRAAESWWGHDPFTPHAAAAWLHRGE